MRIRLAKLALAPAVLAATLLGLTTAQASAVPAVYVSQGSGTGGLSAFTIGPTGALTAVTGSPFALSAFPAGISFSPTTGDIYAGSNGPSGFSIAPATGALTALPGSPYVNGGQAVAEVVISPDGTRAYTPTGLNNNLRTYSIGSNGALTQIGPPLAIPSAPLGAAMTPDGNHLYVPQANAGTIKGYDVAADGSLTERPDSPYPGGTAPFSPAVTPDGKFLYVTDFTANQLRGYAIQSNGSLLATPGSPYAGFSQPFHLAVAPDGQHLYVANQGSGAVAGFTINANGSVSALVGSPYIAGAGSKGIGMTPDGKHLYTANLTANNVAAFNVAANGALSTVTGSPYAIPGGGNNAAVTPDRSPTAAFSTLQTPNAPELTLNGAASTDTDGTIARYDWDFGDGTTLADGGPAPKHTFPADGTYTVKLTLTDDVGCSADPRYTGQFAYCGNAAAATLTKQVTVDSQVKGAKLKAKKKQVPNGKVAALAKVKAGEAVGVKVTAKVKAGGKTLKLKPVSKRLGGPGSAKVKLKLKKKSDAAKLAAALGGKVPVKIMAKFTDDAGNTAKQKAKVKLLAG